MNNLTKDEQTLYDYELDFQVSVNRLSKEVAIKLAERKIQTVRESEKKKPFKEMVLISD